MPQATVFPIRAFFICPRARESDFGTMLVQQFQRFEETRSRTRVRSQRVWEFPTSGAKASLDVLALLAQ